MASKEKLVEISIEATGDSEIMVAGDFQPKGMAWKRAAGAAAGSLVGGAASDNSSWAKAAGAAGGMAFGTLASTASKHLPPVVVLAASPTKVYVMATSMGQSTFLARHLEVLHVMDREQMSVTLKNRMTVRTAVIEDEATGARFELEGVKLGFHHMNDLLNLLDEQDASEAQAESEARLAAAQQDASESGPL